ncbi:ssDNA-binding protein, mitochondrial [Bachmanniomyces sp. S44760]|nr:ssDNA-binding protein, mitochondrial [Bachmanniomyces sp. S44760]
MPPLHRFIPTALPRPLYNRAFPLRAFSTTPANHVAKLTLVGRVAAPPELQPTSTGQDIVKYAIGTGHGPPENRQTSWWNITSFAPEGQRERILGLDKGTLVYVEGEAKMKGYTDKEGQQRKSLNITQNKMEILKRPSPQSTDE